MRRRGGVRGAVTRRPDCGTGGCAPGWAPTPFPMRRRVCPPRRCPATPPPAGRVAGLKAVPPARAARAPARSGGSGGAGAPEGTSNGGALNARPLGAGASPRARARLSPGTGGRTHKPQSVAQSDIGPHPTTTRTSHAATRPTHGPTTTPTSSSTCSPPRQREGRAGPPTLHHSAPRRPRCDGGAPCAHHKAAMHHRRPPPPPTAAPPTRTHPLFNDTVRRAAPSSPAPRPPTQPACPPPQRSRPHRRGWRVGAPTPPRHPSHSPSWTAGGAGCHGGRGTWLGWLAGVGAATGLAGAAGAPPGTRALPRARPAPFWPLRRIRCAWRRGRQRGDAHVFFWGSGGARTRTRHAPSSLVLTGDRGTSNAHSRAGPDGRRHNKQQQ